MTPLALRSTKDLLAPSGFGGRRVRRLAVQVGAERLTLLLHEEGKGSAYVLSGAERAGMAGMALTLSADLGEGLGQVQALELDPVTGRVRAYLIRGRGLSDVVVNAADTYWWEGELYCQRRRTAQLRTQRRQARAEPSAA